MNKLIACTLVHLFLISPVWILAKQELLIQSYSNPHKRCFVIKVVMNEYEKEIEESRKDFDSKLAQSESKISSLQSKLDRIELDKNTFKKEADQFENKLEKAQQELQKTLDKGMNN